MADLVQPQIREACRLSMPEGLKELMSDISREVLRAQPENIYDFIASYLSALLVTRDNLAIATHVCDHVCDCDCRQLIRELIDIGLSESDAGMAQNVIMKYFSKDKVDEANLLSTLMAKTKIEASMLPEVINAIRAAYFCHQSRNYTKYETSSDSDRDEISMAATHTLNLYRQTRPSEAMYHQMAQKIQASYRAYGVRRTLKSETDHSPAEAKTSSHDSSFSEDVKQEMELTASMTKRRMNTVSSLSLAGSYCTLPSHKPYNVHDMDCLSQLDETSEKEHAHIDYTARSPHVSVVNDVEGDFDEINQRDEIKHKIEGENEGDVDEETNYNDLHDLIVLIDDDYKNIPDYDSDVSILDSDGYDGDVNDDVSETKTAYNYVNEMNKEIESDSEEDCD